MKTLHISIILAVLIFGIVLVVIMTVLQENPQEVLSVKSPVLPQNTTIDYYANMTSQITLKPLQIQTIPVQIYAPQDKPLHVKMGLTVPNKESNFIATGNGSIPFGIFTMLNKNEINLPATSEKGTAVRDTIQLTVFAYPFTSGTYKIAVLLYQDTGEANSRYFTIRVD
ncbi:exported protein of unknown function [Nitrosotalea devaniterrae]|uniref:Uncharacterized protein n=1 Tax=Nitrosotalea devaniterrae TaxID=1078905 RepID=A0A128A218_9ARCH|nr:exported protein of unknown function [Candidatus Nitrosotalea devanaterra]